MDILNARIFIVKSTEIISLQIYSSLTQKKSVLGGTESSR